MDIPDRAQEADVGGSARPGPVLSVLVVGAGLVGASVGLALRRQGWTVHLRDRHPEQVRLAAMRGAGLSGDPETPPDVVVVAVPPGQLAASIAEALAEWPAAVVTDVGSVKAGPLYDLGALGADLSRYVGSHPMAGSERSGPLAASADLFDGRAWAVTPHPAADPAAVDQVTALVRVCGAELVTMTPAEHDAAVARVSHLPHLLAVLAAARLHEAPPEHLELSGQGLRDVTRIAGGDPRLWQQILSANAGALLRLLGDVRADLDRLLEQLAAPAPDLAGLLERGELGTRAIPGKHGGPVRALDTVFVLVPDRPGELARLFADVGAAGSNIEDVRIDHDLGRPSGLVELAVQQGTGERLVGALGEKGWAVHR